MRKFVKSTGATGHKPRSLRAGIFATALTMVAIVALAATPREELATRGLDFTANVFEERAGAGDMEAVKLFLAAGMDVNAVSRFKAGHGGAGRRANALLAASSGGHAEIVSYLIGKGAAVDKKDHHGQTPLMAALIVGHTEIVELLVARGADVNAKSAQGQTPLIYAAMLGHVELVRLLIRHKADVNALTKGFSIETPLDKAHDPEIIRLLRASGGKKASELQ